LLCAFSDNSVATALCSEKAPKRFNTFGGSIGGPLSAPELYDGHQKTFFFFDYEGNRRRTSQPEQYLVPTAAERSGNLSGLVSPGQTLLDSTTGSRFRITRFRSRGSILLHWLC
jgi:hypothetical protein